MLTFRVNNAEILVFRHIKWTRFTWYRYGGPEGSDGESARGILLNVGELFKKSRAVKHCAGRGLFESGGLFIFAKT